MALADYMLLLINWFVKIRFRCQDCNINPQKKCFFVTLKTNLVSFQSCIFAVYHILLAFWQKGSGQDRHTGWPTHHIVENFFKVAFFQNSHSQCALTVTFWVLCIVALAQNFLFLFMLWFKFYNLKYDIQLQSANLFGKF